MWSCRCFYWSNNGKRLWWTKHDLEFQTLRECSMFLPLAKWLASSEANCPAHVGCILNGFFHLPRWLAAGAANHPACVGCILDTNIFSLCENVPTLWYAPSRGRIGGTLHSIKFWSNPESLLSKGWIFKKRINNTGGTGSLYNEGEQNEGVHLYLFIFHVVSSEWRCIYCILKL